MSLLSNVSLTERSRLTDVEFVFSAKLKPRRCPIRNYCVYITYASNSSPQQVLVRYLSTAFPAIRTYGLPFSRDTRRNGQHFAARCLYCFFFPDVPPAKFARFYELREASKRRGRVNGRRRILRSLAKILLIGPITPIIVNDTDDRRFQSFLERETP